METDMVSFTPNTTTFEAPPPPPNMNTNLEQTQEYLNLYNMNSVLHFNHQLQTRSTTGFYGNQIIIMEDSNLFVNLNEFESESFIFSNQFNYQAQPSPKIFQLQGSYQDQYTDKQSINCQQQMSDIKGHGLPTMSNYPLEQTLTHSNNIRSESEFQCSPKAISATVKKSSPNGIASCKKREVDRFSKFIPFEKRILKFQLPLYCPVQNCRHNLTKFYKRYSLLKHCFQAHVHYGKPYKKLSIQEQTILTLIIPHCATCDRLFSRNDSLKRHLRQLHN